MVYARGVLEWVTVVSDARLWPELNGVSEEVMRALSETSKESNKEATAEKNPVSEKKMRDSAEVEEDV